MGDYSHLKGTGIALVTPFNNDLSIDWEGLKRLLKFTADNGADYFVVMGTTAESATLSAKEKAEILAFVKANNDKKLPLVYGIGNYSTQEVLNTIDQTNLEGIDAILSVCPYYNKPSQEGITAHFKAIAEHSPVPVLLYNVPGRTVVNMSYKTTIALSQHKNIIGIKEAAGDLQQIMRIAKYKTKDFLLISGDDMFTPALAASGGDGVISVLANSFPTHFQRLFQKASQNDFIGASEEVYPFLELNRFLYEESNPVGIKYILNKQGICGTQVRLPLLQASPALQQKIDQEITSASLL